MVIKMNLDEVLKKSTHTFIARKIDMLILSGINFIFMIILGIAGADISSPIILPWAVAYYIFWSCFFRYCFGRTPYFRAGRIFRSVLPSGKILLLATGVLFALLCLPILPLYISLPFNLSEYAFDYMDKYMAFLQSNLDESSNLDLFMSFLFIFISPFVFIRPLFAWISVLLGKGGSIRYAFSKTRGNYFKFVILGVIMSIFSYISKEATELLISYISSTTSTKLISFTIFSLIISPIFVYFNIVFAKMYEVFFSEKVKI